MDTLHVARLAHDMVRCQTREKLSECFLRAVVTHAAILHGVGFGLDVTGTTLIPVTATGIPLESALPVGMEDVNHPLVYCLIQGAPCLTATLSAMTEAWIGLEPFRERCTGNDAMLALPVRDLRGRAIGALLLAGSPRQLQAWRDDPLWQQLLAIHGTLCGHLHDSLDAAAQAHFDTARQAREEERVRSRAARLLAAGFVGVGAVAKSLREDMLRIADSSLAALITGETGTGKDHAAWLIHQASACRGKFVPVNCAAIPKDLIEAELFGSARGAFTGATQARTGLVAEAHDGTLFLDEIGDMPLPLQATLLRLLNEKKYRPVGDTRERESNFRLLCATHQPLPQRIREGLFREDLYFRVRQLTLHLPPLRERADDIDALAAHALMQHNRECNQHVAGIAAEALALLRRHRFPGNVRELRTLIMVAAEFTAPGADIDARTIRRVQQNAQNELSSSVATPSHTDAKEDTDRLRNLLETDNLPVAVRAFEQLLIDDRLRRVNGSRRRAALSLGIPKRTLARKCQIGNVHPKEPLI